MDADRCARLFEDAGADGSVLQARGSEPIMNSMRTMVVDKIASVTQACGLSHELRIAPEIPSEEVLVLVFEILNTNATYNTFDLITDLLATLIPVAIVLASV